MVIAAPRHSKAPKIAREMQRHREPLWQRYGGAYAFTFHAVFFLALAFFMVRQHDMHGTPALAQPLDHDARWQTVLLAEYQEDLDETLAEAVSALDAEKVREVCMERGPRPLPQQGGRHAVHVTLARQFSAMSDTQEERGLADFTAANAIVEDLVDHCGDDTAAWMACPINDAIHFRTFFAQSGQLCKVASEARATRLAARGNETHRYLVRTRPSLRSVPRAWEQCCSV